MLRRNNMKLTDQIKEKIENAKSEEEVKTILENVKGGGGCRRDPR